ncbi:MAG TPA: hypothetical protein VG406_16610 [Isosphaeraceae bacterium]|jgi:hypothetical protein|nr:hypothetical protein [Isosphaeraceae bacterium]
MSQANDGGPETPAQEPFSFEPQVRGESQYDRVTSGLMSVVVGAFLVFGWLSLMYITSQAYADRVSQPVEIIEVSGGGGDPEGTPGSTEKVDVPGAEPDKFASNNENEPAEFEEPSVQEEPAVALDVEAMQDAGDELANSVDLAAEMPRGGAVATGKRASKIGKGGPGFGPGGPGDGGFSREQRWSIVYPPGQTPEEYARQLDAFKVELGAITGGVMQVASNLSSATPTRRTIDHRTEKRLYFLYQGQGRRVSDIELLKKAGINVTEGATFQFYPKEVEDALAQLENRYRHLQPAQIRLTRFEVVRQGNRWGFKVVAQERL